MLECYRKCHDIGALAMVHAENGDVIDRVCALTGPQCVQRFGGEADFT
jgi:hypothetical protein